MEEDTFGFYRCQIARKCARIHPEAVIEEAWQSQQIHQEFREPGQREGGAQRKWFEVELSLITYNFLNKKVFLIIEN